MKVGYAGLGHMGRVQAERLIEQGADLVVWNRTRVKAEGLGVPIADSPAELMARTDAVFLCVSDSQAVDAILFGPDGLLDADAAGKVVVDTSTNHFDAVLSFRELLTDARAHYIESPVIGSIGPAREGRLLILASGGREPFEKVRPYLEIIASSVLFFDEPGLPTKMKLVNNLVLGGFMASLAEAMALAEGAGVDPVTMADVLEAGAGQGRVLASKRDKLLSGEYSTQFSAGLLHKDLVYAMDLARSVRKPMLLGGLVKELYAMTFSDTTAEQDMSVIFETLKEH